MERSEIRDDRRPATSPPRLTLRSCGLPRRSFIVLASWRPPSCDFAHKRGKRSAAGPGCIQPARHSAPHASPERAFDLCSRADAGPAFTAALAETGSFGRWPDAAVSGNGGRAGPAVWRRRCAGKRRNTLSSTGRPAYQQISASGGPLGDSNSHAIIFTSRWCTRSWCNVRFAIHGVRFLGPVRYRECSI